VQGLRTIHIRGIEELLGGGVVQWFLSFVCAGYDSPRSNVQREGRISNVQLTTKSFHGSELENTYIGRFKGSCISIRHMYIICCSFSSRFELMCSIQITNFACSRAHRLIGLYRGLGMWLGLKVYLYKGWDTS